MKIIYTGELSSGQLQCPMTGRTFIFTKGQALDVPDKLGQSAVVQGNWKEAAEELKAVKPPAKKNTIKGEEK